jgi:hypothetical protein
VDELLEGMVDFVVVLVCLATYLIILAIPFILHGLAVYHGGRKFGQQLRGHELGDRAHLVLCGLGAISVLVTAVPAVTGAWHPITVLLAVPLFLDLAISTLGAWALATEWPYRERLGALEQQVSQAEEHVRAVNGAMASIAATASGIEAQHADALRLRAELVALVDRLCETDAQVWGVRRRRWEAEFSGLSDAELGRRLRDTSAELGRAQTVPAPEATGPAMRACLLRVEELRRVLAQPDQELARLRSALDRHAREAEQARGRLEQLRLERSRATAALEAFRSSRVRVG